MAGEPLNQAVASIFYQVFTIFPPEDRGECGAQAGLCLVQEHVW